MSNDPTRDPSSAAEPAARGSGPIRVRLLSATQRGILWMLGSTVLFSMGNAAAKYLTQSYHVVEVLWGRFTFAALLLTVIYGRRLARTMATRRLGLQLIRSSLTVGSTALFLLALHLLPLTEATALLFTGPIFVALLSRPLLSETVGPGRWLGIALGFAGAVVITRPGTTGFQVAWLVALGAALLFAFYLITTRMVSRSDSAATTLIYTNIVGMAATSAVLPFVWSWPDALGWTLIGVVSGVATAATFAMIKAFETAPAATVSPLTYVGLVWTAAFGLAVFGEVPDGWTIAGTALIGAAGLYLFRQERGGPPAGPPASV